MLPIPESASINPMPKDSIPEPVVGLSSAVLPRLPYFLIGSSLIFVVTAVLVLAKSSRPDNPIIISELKEATVSGEPEYIYIDVAGEVKTPGVYKLKPGARVEDAIQAAGGLGKKADLELVAKNLNRAQIIGDGAKVFVPTVDDNTMSHNNGFTTNTNIDIDSSQNQGYILQQPDGISQNIAGTSVMNINTASQSELESLSGIGPVTAQKIISNRPYTSLDDLVSRKVMYQSLLDKLRSQLSL